MHIDPRDPEFVINIFYYQNFCHRRNFNTKKLSEKMIGIYKQFLLFLRDKKLTLEFIFLFSILDLN